MKIWELRFLRSFWAENFLSVNLASDNLFVELSFNFMHWLNFTNPIFDWVELWKIFDICILWRRIAHHICCRIVSFGIFNFNLFELITMRHLYIAHYVLVISVVNLNLRMLSFLRKWVLLQRSVQTVIDPRVLIVLRKRIVSIPAFISGMRIDF